METKKNLLYEELTYDVLGCAYNAFKIVGVGFDEVRYHKIFHEYLGEKGLNAKYKEQFYIEYFGERLIKFEMDEIVEDKLIVELKQNKINYDDNVVIDTNIGNIKFNPFGIDYWLIEKSYLVGILAGKEKLRLYDLLRMRTYLRKLNLHHGLIAFWSNKNLQLYGINEQ